VKIHWLSPVAVESAIARFSELWRSGCAITVVSTHTDQNTVTPRPFLAQWQWTGPMSASVAEQYDIVIVNFGDHFPNHGNALEALRWDRVLGIFHDADMSNFGHGAELAHKAELLSCGADNPDSVTAQLAAQCAGAVVHAPFYEPLVSGCDGPIAQIPLAWALPPGAAAPADQKGDDRQPDDMITIVTFGHINANKCADRVIEAVAGSPVLRGKVRYRLIGLVAPNQQEHLSALAARGGVDLDVLGPVDEPVLHEALRSADIIMCLRHPVLEGASASAIEAMLHGRAVVVSDAGFYAGLPDGAVAKVPLETTAEAIRSSLEALVGDPSYRTALGARARDYAEDVFAPRRYATSLIAFCEQVRIASAYQPTLAHFAAKLAALGLSGPSALLEPVVAALEKTGPVRRRASASPMPGHLSDTVDAP